MIRRILSPSPLIRSGTLHRFPCAFQSTSEAAVSLPREELCIELKPSEVVAKLDEYIVGQADAKRAVAIALRNRWRRHRLPEPFKSEVIPKNILMIGPTGCGKTEIARRLSHLSKAPFVKVEATKYTEVGFHGKDVDQIIRDLVENAISLMKKSRGESLRPQARKHAQDIILSIVMRKSTTSATEETLNTWKTSLENGELDDKEVTIDVAADPPDMSRVEQSVAAVTQALVGRPSKSIERRTMLVKEAIPILEEQELEKLLETQNVTRDAVHAAQENGIVFIDEIDKICRSPDSRGGSGDASDEGVQRDLLPLIEGSVVTTKHGNVDTSQILFIASGAFHHVKPSDLMAEFQGRLPIRVELNGLTEDDMLRILTEPKANLIRQQIALLKTENVDVEFEPDSLREIARVAVEANTRLENIGARRLHSVIEVIMEDLSFFAGTKEIEPIKITKELVQEKTNPLLVSTDIKRFIL